MGPPFPSLDSIETTGRRPAREAPLMNDPQKNGREKIRLLLIEDDPGDAALLRLMLSEAGFSVDLETAGTAADGAAHLKNNEFDIVLLDLGLPDTNGIETFYRISKAAGSVPILVLSGNEDEHQALDAVKAGAQDYLIKSAINGSALDRCIRYAIERKKTESALREKEQSLQHLIREKDGLLREIHHRIKNNLQLVVSLLNLQAGLLTDPAARTALKESRQRVRTISLIHEQLYRTENRGRVGLYRYLQSLISNIASSFGEKGSRVVIEWDLEEVELPLGKAVPLGLLVNELLTNAIQHAFPDGRPGKIRVSLSRPPDGGIVLAVADDGVGIPAGLDFRKTETLGLQIVTLLAEQLDGRIDLVSQGGTRFRIEFEETLLRPNGLPKPGSEGTA
jgi:two-component sensor histidine kinase